MIKNKYTTIFKYVIDKILKNSDGHIPITILDNAQKSPQSEN